MHYITLRYVTSRYVMSHYVVYYLHITEIFHALGNLPGEGEEVPGCDGLEEGNRLCLLPHLITLTCFITLILVRRVVICLVAVIVLVSAATAATAGVAWVLLTTLSQEGPQLPVFTELNNHVERTYT